MNRRNAKNILKTKYAKKGLLHFLEGKVVKGIAIASVSLVSLGLYGCGDDVDNAASNSAESMTTFDSFLLDTKTDASVTPSTLAAEEDNSFVNEDESIIQENIKDDGLEEDEKWELDEASTYTTDDNVTYYFYYHPDDEKIATSEHITRIVTNQSSLGKDFSTFKETLLIQLESTNCTITYEETSMTDGYDTWMLAYGGKISGTDTPYYCYMISVNKENIIYSYVYTYFDATTDVSFVDDLVNTLN